MEDVFDNSLLDSQATAVKPILVSDFDLDRYHDYELNLLKRCEDFWHSNQGVLVYRRFRVAPVFSFDSKDMKKSLEWQLGGLKASLDYMADVPNYIEPWYGLGTTAAAYGFDYIWPEGQAPAVNGHFSSVEELLEHGVKPIKDTIIGKHTIEMAEYFLNATKGKLPISLCDFQSPLNTVGNVVDINNFFMDFMMNPDAVKKAFDLTADSTIEFIKVMENIIGDCLAKPGHGFASCRCFDGLGLSDDNIVMISEDMYRDIAMPSYIKTCSPFGGGAFHSCGNWSDKQNMIAHVDGLRMADGAFSKATDPNANPTDGFADSFAHSGVILNVRIVGTPDIIEKKVKELWKPGMKLIVNTYCKTPEEQKIAYEKIHEICQ